MKTAKISKSRDAKAKLPPIGQEIVVRREPDPPADPTTALMRTIDRAASDPNFDVDKLSALLKVKQEWEAAEARKAFVAAMAEFKAEQITLRRNKLVEFSTSRGQTSYRHATLDSICDEVIPALTQHGFAHRWETEQGQGDIAVACVITHVAGHSERTTLRAKADDSGGKNSIQAIGSTVTYLQRYTLLSATGLAVKDMDDDGNGTGAGKDLISEAQANDIRNLIAETASELGPVLDYVKAESIGTMTIEQYRDALSALHHRKKKMREAGTLPEQQKGK